MLKRLGTGASAVFFTSPHREHYNGGMKLYLNASNDSKTVGIGSNDTIEFELLQGNKKMSKLRWVMLPSGPQLQALRDKQWVEVPVVLSD